MPDPTHDPWLPLDGKCNARRTDGSGLCRRAAGQATDHVGIGQCSKHGGCTPNANKHAERERLVRVEAEVAERLSAIGVAPVGDPLEAFADVVAEARALQEFFRQRIDELGTSLRFTDDRGGEQLRAEVALYERALDRSAKLLAEWVKLGFDERVVRLREEQGLLLWRVVELIADRLGFDDDERLEVEMRRAVLEVTGVEVGPASPAAA